MAKKPSNARLTWEESMPPLAEAFEDFKGFAKGELRMNRIYQLLAILIQSHRRLVARRFYTTRDLGEFFGVSAFTVAQVFRRLQREGLLTLIRGSQTMIPARIPRTRITVRGLVAMPIWMPAFLNFGDWRRWCAIVQRELSHHRFAAEPVFFSAEEDTKLISFAERVLKFNPDYILWFFPIGSDLNAIRSFTEVGVPVITVNGTHDHYPTRAYPLSRDKAMQQGLKEWLKSGEIDEIIVPMGVRGLIAENLETALKSYPLPHRILTATEDKADVLKYLGRIASKSRQGIIFEDELLYAVACSWAPEIMLEIFRKNRCMVMRQVILPGCPSEGIKVDVLSYSYEQLAQRITLDLSQAKGGIASRQADFHAEWRPKTPLSEVSQSTMVE